MAYFNGKRILNARVEGLYETGYTEGYTQGEQDGKETEWSALWDAIQQKGERKQYAQTFMGAGWTDETFTPKYDIVPDGSGSILGGYQMFYGSKITDLVAALENAGVTLDTSNEQVLDYAFGYTTFTHLPTISLAGVTGAVNRIFYYNSKLITIDKVITNAKVQYTNWFSSTTNLENITFEGEIAYNFSVSPCTKLTHDSLMSIIDHLATVSTTKTLTLGETNLAKLTDAEKAIATEKGWTLA